MPHHFWGNEPVLCEPSQTDHWNFKFLAHSCSHAALPLHTTPAQALYHTGANVSCLSEEPYHKLTNLKEHARSNLTRQSCQPRICQHCCCCQKSAIQPNLGCQITIHVKNCPTLSPYLSPRMLYGSTTLLLRCLPDWATRDRPHPAALAQNLHDT